MTLSRSPQCRAFNRAVINEKLLFPLFPVGVCVCGGGHNGYKWLVLHSLDMTFLYFTSDDYMVLESSTRIRPVLVKNMIILASYVNKWTFI